MTEDNAQFQELQTIVREYLEGNSSSMANPMSVQVSRSNAHLMGTEEAIASLESVLRNSQICRRLAEFPLFHFPSCTFWCLSCPAANNTERRRYWENVFVRYR